MDVSQRRRVRRDLGRDLVMWSFQDEITTASLSLLAAVAELRLESEDSELKRGCLLEASYNEPRSPPFNHSFDLQSCEEQGRVAMVRVPVGQDRSVLRVRGLDLELR
ncbi:hypothetical protein ACJRO7_010352 [Eucalyptus globulus]|uniref:Uncharacterized protein n=1 Tax=Eucalyptus globulus TaxID=34317 RepID=A0ABD3LBS0_EUCGL